jgi:prolyl oligopeptidase
MAVMMALALAAAASGGAMDDPYIWLEEPYAPKALAWVEAENARTLSILEQDPAYPALYADALKIAEATDRVPNPNLIGGAVYNFWQDAGHVRGIWRMTTPAGYAATDIAWKPVLDLDALSTAEKANWVWKGADCEPIKEQRCLLRLSDGGEDATTEREFDLTTGAFVPGGFTLPTSKQNVSWEDPETLLVARDWGAGSMTKSGYPFVVKRLKRGQPLSSAVEIFRGAETDVSAGPNVLVDAAGQKVVLFQRGLDFFHSDYSILTPKGIIKLEVPQKGQIYGMVDGQIVMLVQEDWAGTPIKGGSLVSFDAKAAMSGKPVPTLIYAPGDRQSVDSDEVQLTRSRVLATVNDNVRGRIWSFGRSGAGWTAKRLPMPDNAATYLVTTDRTSDQAYLNATSFLLPSTIYTADAAAGTTQSLKVSPARFDASGLVSEQFEAVSKDGTRIPYFIVHPKGVAPKGGWPTILDAYGGFEVVNTPSYRGVMGKLWLERGGAYVLANIRGGGEFGPAWHEAALNVNRQRAYDDFAAVGEDLVKRGFTSKPHLGITGGSNGGLLMGVELTQRPDLWSAVNINVPLLDMIRISKIAAGASWQGEYGDVADPAIRAFWDKVSPYQQLSKTSKLPMPYIFTTTKDDRVGPGHARKFAARMKEFGLPYLYYENTEGGHGAGANLKQVARTNALQIVYFKRQLEGTQ